MSSYKNGQKARNSLQTFLWHNLPGNKSICSVREDVKINQFCFHSSVCSIKPLDYSYLAVAWQRYRFCWRFLFKKNDHTKRRIWSRVMALQKALHSSEVIYLKPFCSVLDLFCEEKIVMFTICPSYRNMNCFLFIIIIISTSI